MDYKQSQFELFPREHPPHERKDSPPFWGNLNLSLENLITFGIIFIVCMVVSFSLGVEKGKRQTRAKLAKNAQLAFNVPQESSSQPIKENPTQPQPSDQKTLLTNEGLPVKVAALVPYKEITKTIGKGISKLNESQYQYTIQVASYKQESYAKREAADLEKKGFEALVLNKGDYSIVCVGKFVGKKEASSLMSKLRGRYKDCLIRRL